MRVVIIGAVAAGTSAATEIRRNDKSSEIVLYEKDRYISYSNCGMPYYLGNVFSRFEDLVPRDANFFRQKHNINVQILHEVLSINIEAQTLLVRNLLTGTEFQDRFDKLIIATGAKAEKPAFEGSARKNVFLFRNISDLKNIKTFLSINRPKKAVIIGSGPIGLELAENLTRIGLKTTLIARSSISKGLSPELSRLVEQQLLTHGVDVITNASIKGITEKGVFLEDGNLHVADIVLLATGVKPCVELATASGIQLGSTGAIQVNRHMQTNNSNVYACGDCAEYFHQITGKPVYRPLGSTANKTGIIAGNHIAGGNDEFQGVLGTSIVQVFNLTVAQTGLTEQDAALAGYDVLVSLDGRPNKPEFMGGEEMMIKTVADRKSGLLLGCQIVGTQGVDRRIDVIAAAITLKAKIDDLVSMDLAYSPPYSTPKDPLFFTGVKLRQQRK